MSDEELDKLAAAMKDMKPTDTARRRGMDAAMEAFDAEFMAQAEKISEPAQGLEREARPTDQTIKGSTLMSKFKSAFNIPPRSAMLLGSCLAAMTFAMVIMPPALDQAKQEQFSKVSEAVEIADVQSEPAEKGVPGVVDLKKDRNARMPGFVAEADTDEEIAVIGSRITRDDVAQLPNGSIEVQGKVIKPGDQSVMHATQPAPETEQSVSNILQQVRKDSAQVLTENRQREAKFRSERDQRTGLLTEARAELRALEMREGKTPTEFGEMPETEADMVREYSELLQRKNSLQIYRDGEPKTVEIERPRDRFEAYEPNPITAVKEKPVSTFSVDVDTASYSFLRSTINRGQLPRPGSIRLEEMINYFPYDYAAPRSKTEPFKANVTVTPSPWSTDTKLMHIGIKGYVPPASETPSSHITFLIDTSGSMRAQNKLPLLIESFKVLLETLDEDDTVSIVTYAGSAGTVLEPTPASETGTIKRALNRLQAGGSTAGAAGLALAYEKAQESFMEEGVNRVILATDGDFNVGFSSPDEMKRFIEEKRKSGIFLSVLGFGQGNYNDALMQSLAQNGNGVAAYIDSLAEAKKVLADEAGSALVPIAKDVKIQVEFNPSTIAEYRLIGYETRALKREDFNNDKVDAGDINSGHSVTAIYELTPVGSETSVDDLRYARAEAPADTGSDEFAFIKIRHKLPSANKSTLQTFPIGPSKERSLTRANDDMRFATAVAAFGQKLRGDSQLADYSYADIARMASDAQGEDKHGYRAEFLDLVREADRLSGE